MVRKIVELGLAKRDEAGIKVRQPLLEIKVINAALDSQYEFLIKDELNIKNVIFENNDQIVGLAVELNLELTQELREEGMKREIVRNLNNLRKESGMTIKDRAVVFFDSDSTTINNVFAKYSQEILRESLSELIENKKVDFGKEFDVNGEKAFLGIQKII